MFEHAYTHTQNKKNASFRARHISVQTLALPFMNCVALGKVLNHAKYVSLL